MLNYKQRLKKSQAFLATFKLKNCFYSEGLTLYAGRECDEENYLTKVGFVVSKKVHKRAVVRNKIKRRMRDIYRVLYKEGKIQDKYLSLIFVANPKILEYDFSKISETMQFLMNKFDLMTK